LASHGAAPSNAIRKRIRVCFIDVFSFYIFDFMLLHLSSASFLRAAQMCFCPVKRKSRLKPAKFFFAPARPRQSGWALYPQPILDCIRMLKELVPDIPTPLEMTRGMPARL
jgi:hypothetical protein